MKPTPGTGGAAAAVLVAALAFDAGAVTPAMEAEVRAGIDAVYRMDFDGAAARCEAMRRVEPGHPYPEFGLAAVAWARYVYGSELGDDSLIKPFDAQVDKAIATAKAWQKAHPEDPEALMALGAAQGISARLQMTRRQYIKGYFSARSAVKSMQEAVRRDPGFIDAVLGLGMYDYYTDLYPRMIRPLAKVILRGDRARGIARIKEVAERGRWAPVTAKMILVEISLHDPFGARDPKLAVKLMDEVRALYPGSAMLHSAQLIALYQAGRLKEFHDGAVDFVKRAEDGRYRRFDLAKGDVLLGASLWGLGRKDEAVAAYLRGASLRPRNRWSVWALIRAGHVLDMMGRRAEAVLAYKEASEEPDRWGYKEYAVEALKRPYRLAGEFTVDPP